MESSKRQLNPLKETTGIKYKAYEHFDLDQQVRPLPVPLYSSKSDD